ncbi:ABC transporter permease (plasmid) [Rhizobium sp. CB3060]|uniref:ABC transporter permease n=1 Tax=Rhizobium sp. CB3060 TaxID=3138255 RepID=UPI0021A2A5D1|nr:ABC transporter permease [Rhizobium tropici]UWU25499.1 ABC transporter permease [Rhizobium tropici]
MSSIARDAKVELKAPLDPALVRRNQLIGLLLIFMAVAVTFTLGYHLSGTATFNLDPPRAVWKIGSLKVPAAPYVFVVSAVIAVFGFNLLVRVGSHRANLLLGIALALAVTAFLTWATADKSLSLVGLLQATVVRAVPIAFGGLAGVLCERVGIVNIGIEGMMLAGAFTGAVVGSLVGGYGGLLAATFVGGLIGLLLAVLTVKFLLDHIIAGVIVNMLVLGLTSYAASQVLVRNPDLNHASIFRAVEIPFLSQVPLIGPIIFSQNIFVYAALVMLASATYYLFHTRFGLRARSVGEYPRAADTLGIDVLRTRTVHVVLGGMVAGFGGAWFTLGAVGQFDANMTAGRGFIGLAAMIFGRWHPMGVLAAALVFGFADTLQQKLIILQTPVPSDFLAMAPYIATIVVVAGLVGRARAPAADGHNYVKA